MIIAIAHKTCDYPSLTALYVIFSISLDFRTIFSDNFGGNTQVARRGYNFENTESLDSSMGDGNHIIF